MNKFGLTKKDIETIKKSFANFPKIKKVVIFGSRAIGNYKTGSDVDLAIIGKNIDSNILGEIHAFLNEETLLPYFFDVIDYSSTSNKDLKKHIDDKGITFFESSLER